MSGLYRLCALCMLTASAAIVAPNISLATTPVAYFGGNSPHRGAANIEMLSKMRMIMIEKWEGHCWNDCLASNNSKPPVAACTAACDVEQDIVSTCKRAKALNPALSCVLYLNTLLAFPFYALNGIMKANNALTIDSVTKKPIVIRNDNGMEGIYVFGFDTPKGQQLYIDAVKNLTATGYVDGFFGDKWDSQAKPLKNGTWQICNHECGTVSSATGKAWNAGKAKVLAAVTAHVGDGPYFANGDTFDAPCVASDPLCATADPEGPRYNVSSNLEGKWGSEPALKSGDPRLLVKHVDAYLATHKYVYMGMAGDQHWTVDPNLPSSIATNCSKDCHARFLLAVEPGVMLGAEGWDPDYDRPLGNPKGKAVYTAASAGKNATLSRSFASGTKVIFTYGTDPEGQPCHPGGRNQCTGHGEIWWNGVKPPPPPAPVQVKCGSCGSSLLKDTTFAQDDVSQKATVPSALACCALCTADAQCMQWSWHEKDQSHFAAHECHLHGKKATGPRRKTGVVSGVTNRTGTAA